MDGMCYSEDCSVIKKGHYANSHELRAPGLVFIQEKVFGVTSIRNAMINLTELRDIRLLML